MTRSKISLAGRQIVHAFDSLGDELFGHGRAYVFATGHVMLQSAHGQEAMLAIENGNSWPFFVSHISASTDHNQVMQISVIYNPSAHNAVEEFTPFSLNRTRVDTFRGRAFRFNGVDTAGPSGGTLISQEFVQARAMIGRRNSGPIMDLGDTMIVTGTVPAGQALVGVTVVGHYI